LTNRAETTTAIRDVREQVASEPIAWTDLVSLVRRSMRSIAGPTRDLEDLTQTALERVVRSLGAEPRFDARAQLSTFVYRVCSGVAIDHWRWWRRWLHRFELGTQSAAEPATESLSESAIAEGIERARTRRLYELLERMDPARRVVLTLCDLEELSAARVAEILECPEGTVRSRLRQARLELAARVRRDPWFQEDLDGGSS
jgi:RNA polymerase sigma-70 factor, ECF subfamily